MTDPLNGLRWQTRKMLANEGLRRAEGEEMTDVKSTCFTCDYRKTKGQPRGCWATFFDDRCPFHRTPAQARLEKAAEQMLAALRNAYDALREMDDDEWDSFTIAKVKAAILAAEEG